MVGMGRVEQTLRHLGVFEELARSHPKKSARLLGALFKIARTEKDLLISEVAKKTQIYPIRIHEIESGFPIPHCSFFEAKLLGEVLNIPWSKLSVYFINSQTS